MSPEWALAVKIGVGPLIALLAFLTVNVIRGQVWRKNKDEKCKERGDSIKKIFNTLDKMNRSLGRIEGKLGCKSEE